MCCARRRPFGVQRAAEHMHSKSHDLEPHPETHTGDAAAAVVGAGRREPTRERGKPHDDDARLRVSRCSVTGAANLLRKRMSRPYISRARSKSVRSESTSPPPSNATGEKPRAKVRLVSIAPFTSVTASSRSPARAAVRAGNPTQHQFDGGEFLPKTGARNLPPYRASITRRRRQLADSRHTRLARRAAGQAPDPSSECGAVAPLTRQLPAPIGAEVVSW